MAWQVSSELSDLVSSLTAAGPCLEDREFRDQIRRAAKKTPPLIAEGFVRYTKAEMVRYLRMARAELAEVQSWTVHAQQQRFFSPEQQASLSDLADRAMALTTALLKSKLRGRERRPGKRGPRAPRAKSK